MTERRFIKGRELAARWLCSKTKILEMVKAGEVPFVRVGKIALFDMDRIEAYEKANEVDPLAQAD